MTMPESITIEVSDPVIALEQLLDIVLYLRHFTGKYEVDPTEDNRKKKIEFEHIRDNWILKHKVKDYHHGMCDNGPLAKVRVIRKTYHNINEDRILQIVNAVCQHYGLTREDIFHRFKSRDISEKKHMIFWLIRKHTNISLEYVASILGTDHATISNGSKNFKRLLKLDNSYETVVKDIEAQIL